MAPRNTMDERIRRISSSGISWQVMLLSTIRSWPSRLHTQPRCLSISMAVSTSERSGQLCSTVWPLQSRAPARRGRVLFLAPWTESSPESLAGPSIIIIGNTSIMLAMIYYDPYPFL